MVDDDTLSMEELMVLEVDWNGSNNYTELRMIIPSLELLVGVCLENISQTGVLSVCCTGGAQES